MRTGSTCLALASLLACNHLACNQDDARSTLSDSATATAPMITSVTGITGSTGTTGAADTDMTTVTATDTGEDTGAGCGPQDPCGEGRSCCAGACVDLLTDVQHCGACDRACPTAPHTVPGCKAGSCTADTCASGYNNCDGDLSNGCELEGACPCVEGEQIDCYNGPQGTRDVGVCRGGVQTCGPGGAGLGPCEGEVVPGELDICANGIDDDCDGEVDDDVDEDGDGWTVCTGDCCDSAGPECASPELVNPGAFEVMGNKVDDDCDAKVDNVVTACDDGLASDAADPLDYARAIDLCQFTAVDAPVAMRRWGVIDGAFTRADGEGTSSSEARSIRDGFGAVIRPEANTRLAILSTGTAADPNDHDPGYAPFQGGTDLDTDAEVPADWLAANAANFPNVAGCPEPQGGTIGRDSSQLYLRIRVPTNAQSFSVKIYYFSSEYPEWVCSPYNDFFLTLVDSAGADNPADKNVAIYREGDALFPVGVNLLKASKGLFTQCKNGHTGCGNGAVPADYAGCVGNDGLRGTGFDPLNPLPKYAGDPGHCGANNQVGGATGWLKMSGNVQPGETMELRFVIWDTGDEWYDSLVLIDDFQWSVQASEPGVVPG